MFLNSKTYFMLTIKEIKKLDRDVYFNSGFKTWYGKSDGIIRDGVYIRVYPAHTINEGYTFKKCSFINVPLTSIYQF